MTKKQADNYINKVGKKYAHITPMPYFCLLALSLALQGASIGFCRKLDFIIAVGCFLAFGVLFTAITVKKYMSLLRASVLLFVLWALLAASVGCLFYATRLHNQTFIAWECGVYSALAAFVFAFGFAVRYIFSNHAMIKRIIIIAMGGMLSVVMSITGVVLAVLEFADVSLSVGTILANATICLLLLIAARFAVRVYVMLRFKAEYKPEKLTVSGARKEIKSKRKLLFTTVHGYICGEYTLFIYAKMDCYRIDIFKAKTRVSTAEYDSLKTLLDTEKIDGKKLNKMWDMIEPM